MEDIPADQPVLHFHLVRADDIAVGDRSLEAGRHLVVEVDQPVGVGLEFLGVRFARPLGRHPLGEQRHDVRAIGIQRLVQCGGNDAVAKRRQGRAAGAGVLEGRFDELHGRGHLHRAGVVLGLTATRIGGEARQLAQGQVDLHHPAAGLPMLDVVDEVLRQFVARDLIQERGAGMQRGHHQRRVDLVAVIERHALDPAVADQDFRHPRVGADLGAKAPCRAGDGIRHRTHTALGVTPATHLAVADVTDRVVRHDVGGSGFIRAGPGTDHAVDRERALDLRRLEPVVEEVGDAHREQPGDVSGTADRDAPLAPRELGEIGQIRGTPRADLGWHLRQKRPEKVAEPFQPRVPLGIGVGVLLRPLGHFLMRAGRVLVDRQRSALGEGLVVRTHRMHLVAVLLQA